MSRVAVIGAGAFGTALACVVRRAGSEAVIWARDPTIADSILDRLVHNAHRIDLKGSSLRKNRSGKHTEK